jgi:hypothetical protein
MLVYLASPYSHHDPAVMEHRFEVACKVAGALMLRGSTVFAPIAHSHPIGQIIDKPTDHEFWMRQDFAVLQHCAEMVVLMIDGWDRSRGVREEIEFCNTYGIPIRYIFPQDVGVGV